MRAELATLESRIQHHFSDPELLRRALTHSSFANENPAEAPSGDNEQLEFLGDSILGFLVSDELVRRFPSQNEGDLSRQKAHLVSAAHLYGVARYLDLGTFLDVGRSEEITGGRSKKRLLVNALEALIAAIYLDGGISSARSFVESTVLDAPLASYEEVGTDIQPANWNFKSALEDLAKTRNLPQPRYTIVAEHGPDHSKIFSAEVRLGKDWSGRGDGSTKKVAAQRAARSVYERLLREAATVG